MILKARLDRVWCRVVKLSLAMALSPFQLHSDLPDQISAGLKFIFHTFIVMTPLLSSPSSKWESTTKKSKGAYLPQTCWNHWKFIPFYRHLDIWMTYSRLSGQECGSPSSYTWTQPQEWLTQMILWTWSTFADGRTSSENKNSGNKISGNTKSFINWYHKRFCVSCSPLWYLSNNHSPLLQISAGSMLLQDEVRGCVWKMPEGGNSFLFNTIF